MKRKLLLLTAYCLVLSIQVLSSSRVFGAWTRTVIDATNDLSAIHGYAGTSTVALCAVGKNGAAWLSTNYGTTWTSITSGILANTNLSGVTVTSNAIYAGGTGNNPGTTKIFKYDYNSWSDITPSDTTYNYISDVSFLGSKGIFVGGTPGGVVRYTTDGGATWNAPTTPPNSTQNYLAAYYAAENSVWIAGSSGNIWKSEDGGKNWTQKYGSGGNIQDLYFVDATHGFAVDDNSTFYYTFDGNTWNTKAITAISNLYGVYAPDANNVWVAGFDPSPSIVKMTYSGGSWSETSVYTSSTAGDSHHDIFGTDADNMWATGHGGSGIVVKSVTPFSVASCVQKERPTQSQVPQGFEGDLKISCTNAQVQDWNGKLSFSPAGITVNSVTRVSASELNANITTSTTPGSYTGTLTNADGSTTTFYLSVTARPDITSISPATAKQGWLGALTFIGTGFQTATQYPPGANITCSDTGVEIIPGSTNIKSTTEAEIQINVKNVDIPPGQTSKTITFTLTNPDGGNDSISITVERTVSPPQSISSSSDDRIYNVNIYPGGQLISPTPKLKFIFTDSDGFSLSTVNAKIFYRNADGKIWGIYKGDPSNITLSENNTKATFEFQIPTNAPLGGAVAVVGGYIEDIYGNPATAEMPVIIGSTGPTGALTEFLAGPNPTTGITTLQFKSPNDFSGVINIMNTMGQKVSSIPVYIKAGINKIPIDLTTNPSGIYLYLITGDGRTLAKGKVMVAR